MLSHVSGRNPIVFGQEGGWEEVKINLISVFMLFPKIFGSSWVGGDGGRVGGGGSKIK